MLVQYSILQGINFRWYISVFWLQEKRENRILNLILCLPFLLLFYFLQWRNSFVDSFWKIHLTSKRNFFDDFHFQQSPKIAFAKNVVICNLIVFSLSQIFSFYLLSNCTLISFVTNRNKLIVKSFWKFAARFRQVKQYFEKQCSILKF